MQEELARQQRENLWSSGPQMDRVHAENARLEREAEEGGW